MNNQVFHRGNLKWIELHVHFNVTANPTAQWTAQQIAEAFPWDRAAEVLHQGSFLSVVRIIRGLVLIILKICMEKILY